MHSKKIRKNSTALLLAFVMIVFVCTVATFGIKKAVVQAVSMPASVPTDSLKANLLLKSIAGDEKAQSLKEFSLDYIANAAMKIVVQNLTSSIVTWINSGFEGSPAFVGDPQSFFTDVADQVAGNFIAGTELGFMCEPFSLDIRFALNANYSSTFTERNYCRLSDVVGNAENFSKFTSGDFSQGGWDSWFEITQNTSNNPLGAYLSAEGELATRISSALGREEKQLDWGKGFLSFRECEQYGPTNDESDAQCVKYGEIITPGAVIENQLNNALGTGTRQFEVADEINEIVGALIGQLAKTVLTEGLASFGSGGSNYGSLQNNGGAEISGWCSVNTTSSSVGSPVTWSAGTFGGGSGVTTYLWNGEMVSGASTPSVTASYVTAGYKTASVRITKGGQNIFQNCDSGVLVSESGDSPTTPPPTESLAVSCTPSQRRVSIRDGRVPVTWTARVTGGETSRNRFFWSGDNINNPANQSSVLVYYNSEDLGPPDFPGQPIIERSNFVSAQVRVVNGDENVLADCSPEVLVEY